MDVIPGQPTDSLNVLGLNNAVQRQHTVNAGLVPHSHSILEGALGLGQLGLLPTVLQSQLSFQSSPAPFTLAGF
jgi:hypothetical protein